MELSWEKLSSPLRGLTGNNSQCGPVFYDDSIEQYAQPLVTTSHDVLELEQKKCVALCVGIDRQCHQDVAISLGDVVARDAREMSEAFVTNLGFNRDQVKVRVSSAQPKKGA